MITEDLTDYFFSLNIADKSLINLYEKIKNYDNKHFIPAVSLEVAFFLNWITFLKKPKKVLEIGFGSGTSSIFIHKGFPDITDFITLEKDNNRFIRGMELLKKERINKKINLIKIDAFEFLQNNEDSFDLIFLDAVKREYLNYLDLLKKILNSDGILICDNILFNGRVVQDKPEKKYLPGVSLLKKFNEKLSDDKKMKTFFLNIGDGLSLSVKK
jgi:predicted O-methyltransferase YrrM